MELARPDADTKLGTSIRRTTAAASCEAKRDLGSASALPPLPVNGVSVSDIFVGLPAHLLARRLEVLSDAKPIRQIDAPRSTVRRERSTASPFMLVQLLASCSTRCCAETGSRSSATRVIVWGGLRGQGPPRTRSGLARRRRFG
jgi:hypothetical protein